MPRYSVEFRARYDLNNRQSFDLEANSPLHAAAAGALMAEKMGVDEDIRSSILCGNAGIKVSVVATKMIETTIVTPIRFTMLPDESESVVDLSKTGE